MEVFKNEISPHTIEIFKEHYKKYKDDKSVNDINLHEIDIRTRIFPTHKAWDEIKKICIKHFPSITDKEIYANYQRQFKPTFMHVDEYGAYRESDTWTIIIPLHTDTRLSVVIFKKIFNTNEDLQKFIINFPYETEKKCNNISQLVPLQHTPNDWKNPENFLSDYLELDGVFYYNEGDYVLFDTNKLHVTSNFSILPEYKFKDLIQIHIGKSNRKGYDPFYRNK